VTRAEPNQPMSSTQIICRFVAWPRAPRHSVEPWETNGATRFSMKNPGPQDTCEGKGRLRYGVLEVRQLLS